MTIKVYYIRNHFRIHLNYYFPDIAAGPHAEIVPEYFQHMRMLFVEGFFLGDLDDIRKVTAKELYLGYTGTFPPQRWFLSIFLTGAWFGTIGFFYNRTKT
jgi:hypothetical protein